MAVEAICRQRIPKITLIEMKLQQKWTKNQNDEKFNKPTRNFHATNQENTWARKGKRKEKQNLESWAQYVLNLRNTNKRTHKHINKKKIEINK